MPDPLYHRLFGCSELSTRTARTFGPEKSKLMAIGASQRPGQAMSEFSAGILRGRAATPDDITGTTTFLAASDSDYMTGQNISIDGGMVLV